MFRLFHVLAIIVILAAGVVRSKGQSASQVPGSKAALEEAQQLNKLVEKLYDEGKYQEAMVPAARALALREKALGPSHPDVAESLGNLAGTRLAQGEYTRAEPLFVRALAIREEALGPSHPDVAQSLNNLALLYWHQGMYAKAEPLNIRALLIREKALGPSHPDVAQSLNNLAILYADQGAYAKAEPLYLRALAVYEKALGFSHPSVAGALNNAAKFYLEQGAYTKAESLYRRALVIWEKALGPSHPYVALSLNNLAEVFRAQGAYAKAEPLHTRALAIREKTFGPNHPDVAESLNNVALLYSNQGMYAKAEPLNIRALLIREKALGSSHPDVAQSLNNLALLYADQGAYAKAEPLYLRALVIDEKALGPVHPLIATSLNNLALLYRARGDYARAESLVARAADIQEQQFRTELVRLSESRRRALMTLVQEETDSVLSFHAGSMPSSISALKLALTTVLRRKGRILDSMVDSDTRIRNHLTPALRDQLDQLAQTRSELVAQLYAPARSLTFATITATRARIDELESKLSASSAEFRAEVEPVTLTKIQGLLPAGTALVELVRYRRDDPRQPKQRRWQEEHYVAYLVTSRGAPQWVALGEAAPIDAQIDAALAAIQNKATDETTRAELRRLDALVLAPMRARLSSISHLIIAPDGKLNLVPFEVLVDPQGRYALENYLISYVTTGGDLVRLAVPQSPRSLSVIMAGPDYGPPGWPFSPLPEAGAEATDLRTYFPREPVVGGKATKSALAALTGPALLHIATHGFYARDPEPRTLEGTAIHGVRGMFIKSRVWLSRSADPTDGLDRAGLAMAGANQGPGGIVTARELAGFDWSGTQLVVLSACETGVGAVPSGEGVYGMRRALVLAGAASQVVSLWRVSDTSTRALMRNYYRELASGTGRAESLRRSKLGLLREPRYAHPYYWAAFIPAGDWRPLVKNVLSSRQPRG